MTNRTDTRLMVAVRLGGAVCLGVAALGVAAVPGCGEKEEEVAPPPPPPPPPPPEPEPVKVGLIAAEVRPDARVTFPQSSAPYDGSLARAVFGLADALASGDAEGLRTMLDEPSRDVLDWMLDDGTWGESTGPVEAVAVAHVEQTPSTAEEARTGEVYLAVQAPGGSYVLGWRGERVSGSWVFGGIDTTDAELPLAEMWIDQQPRALRPGGEPEAAGGTER